MKNIKLGKNVINNISQIELVDADNPKKLDIFIDIDEIPKQDEQLIFDHKYSMKEGNINASR